MFFLKDITEETLAPSRAMHYGWTMHSIHPRYPCSEMVAHLFQRKLLTERTPVHAGDPGSKLTEEHHL